MWYTLSPWSPIDSATLAYTEYQALLQRLCYHSYKKKDYMLVWIATTKVLVVAVHLILVSKLQKLLAKENSLQIIYTKT